MTSDGRANGLEQKVDEALEDAPDGDDAPVDEPVDAPVDEPVDALSALWANVLDDWDNPAAHDMFLQMAFSQGALGHAASKYRTQLENPSREEVAQKKLKAAALLAMQVLESTKSEPSAKAPRWVLWAAAGVCAGAIALLFYALSA